MEAKGELFVGWIISRSLIFKSDSSTVYCVHDITTLFLDAYFDHASLDLFILAVWCLAVALLVAEFVLLEPYRYHEVRCHGRWNLRKQHRCLE